MEIRSKYSKKYHYSTDEVQFDEDQNTQGRRFPRFPARAKDSRVHHRDPPGSRGKSFAPVPDIIHKDELPQVIQ